MSYAKLDDRLAHHRKVRALPPKLAAAAFGYYVASILFAQLYESDGRIRREDLPMLLMGGPRPSAAITSALVRAGLWDEAEGGWMIHDYLDHNLAAEERRQQRASGLARTKRWRDNIRNASRNAPRDASGDASRTSYTPLLSSPLHSSPMRSDASHASQPDGLSTNEAGPEDRREAFQQLLAETSRSMGFQP